MISEESTSEESTQHEGVTCAPSVVTHIGWGHALRADDAPILQALHEVHILRVKAPAEAALKDLHGVVRRAGLLCLQGMLPRHRKFFLVSSCFSMHTRILDMDAK